jgi:deoxyribodipyrimidine photo-lyase
LSTSIVVFTRDLRTHDQPVLAEAVASSELVVPLFVLEDPGRALGLASVNRRAFLVDSLADLDASLRRLGGGLFVRRGELVEQTMKVAAAAGATAVWITADVSPFAAARRQRLRSACARARCAFEERPGTTVVPAHELCNRAGRPYQVFTSFLRAWRAAPRRLLVPQPRRLQVPEGLARGRLPGKPRAAVRGLPQGGESAGRAALRAWLDHGLARYEELRDDLGAAATSRLGPYLHFGCLSPVEVERAASSRPGGDAFVRQLAWRDFFAHVLQVGAGLGPEPAWRDAPRELVAWQEGTTGYPIVDAAMRQLRAEGFMHNRARMIVASFLTKDLLIDWRLGAAHFSNLLVDGDVASNMGNWRWVAGVGLDRRPRRVFNPVRQAQRFDPQGRYIRRYVPELAGLPAALLHDPAKLSERRPRSYPPALVDHAEAVERFRARRPSRGA